MPEARMLCCIVNEKHATYRYQLLADGGAGASVELLQGYIT